MLDPFGVLNKFETFFLPRLDPFGVNTELKIAKQIAHLANLQFDFVS